MIFARACVGTDFRGPKRLGIANFCAKRGRLRLESDIKVLKCDFERRKWPENGVINKCASGMFTEGKWLLNGGLEDLIASFNSAYKCSCFVFYSISSIRL